jgi:hypothetical protein
MPANESESGQVLRDTQGKFLTGFDKPLREIFVKLSKVNFFKVNIRLMGFY